MKVLISLFIVLIALSCSKNNIAAGSGTDAGEAYGVAVSSTGEPIKNATIYVYTQEHIMGKVTKIDSIYTDSLGQYRYENTAGIYHLEANSNGESAYIKRVEIQADTALAVEKIEVEKTNLILGHIKTLESFNVNSIVLEGTPYECIFSKKSEGLYGFSCIDIPKGTYDLIINDDYLTNVDLSKLDIDLNTINLDTLSFQPNHIVLEDWKAKDRIHLLSELFGTSLWHTNSDDYSIITPLNNNTFADSIKYDSAQNFNYLQVNVQISDSIKNPWTQLNLSLGSGFYNFTSLDSICFNHRGDGDLKISLTVADKNAVVSNDEVDAYLPFSQEWKRDCMTPKDWTKNSKAGTTPAEIISKVNRIKFGLSLGTFWQIGKIELIGLDLKEVFK